ncbi:Uncharacterised protein [Campylobacter hyointestinalis]|uniref:hypothetical protein n=1 Tax=Campylobacter hyointestinalis TaxID=198 RepID=UPI0007289A84|nr:hypothetical protein [Campylobacter hyointestinalis]PPB55471.1 hypothetical protein CDQ67_05365 [Campylobacter hyointestinalis subsp. hyointestinalis]CUU83052.1 Uncharacterised protein [Campylobacter hyointestinalis]
MENSLSFSDEIRATGELINFSGKWGLNEFVVFLLIFGFIAFFVFFWIVNKMSSKNTDLIVEVANKSSEAINNNTAAMREIFAKSHEQTQASNKKLDDIHDDVKEIKFSISHKQVKPSFGKHIQKGEYEDGIY